LIFYGIIGWGALKNLMNIYHPKYSASVKRTFFIQTLLLIFFFIFLYIYPNHPRQANNYKFHLIFNVIFFIDFIIKLLLAISFLCYFFFRKNQKSKIILLAGAIISICVTITLLFSTVQGKREVHLRQIELYFRNLPEQFNNYSILQISDFHLGSFFNSQQLFIKTTEIIEEIQPQLILFTGDLVNNFSNETLGWEKFFQTINSNRQSFSILGNHDYGDYSTWINEKVKVENFDAIVAAHKKMGFHLLRNENVVIRSENDSIFLAGVENWGHWPFPQYANLDKALQNIPDEGFTILLSHDPAHWASQVNGKKNIELTLSGHTHGLQWGIKIAGITFSLSYFTQKYWAGLYGENQSYLYVNTGMGTIGVPWRIDLPAELTLITLKRIKIN
jgi:predicted MPP superfamily phosphohydrolase